MIVNVRKRFIRPPDDSRGELDVPLGTLMIVEVSKRYLLVTYW